MKTKSIPLYLSSFAVLAVAATVAAPASAQQSPWYLSGAVGQSDWSDISVSGYPTEKHELSYGFEAGYRFNKFLSAEIGYVNFGKVAVAPDITSQLSISARSLSESAVLTYPVNDAFSIFGQLGVAQTRRTMYQAGSQSTSEGGGTITVDGLTIKSNKTEALFGVGANYALNEKTSAFVRFQRLNDTKVQALQIGTRVSF